MTASTLELVANAAPDWQPFLGMSWRAVILPVSQ